MAATLFESTGAVSNMFMIIHGETGADTLYSPMSSGTPNAFLDGGPGPDLIYGYDDNGVSYGGAGVDTLYGDAKDN